MRALVLAMLFWVHRTSLVEEFRMQGKSGHLLYPMRRVTADAVAVGPQGRNPSHSEGNRSLKK